MAEGTEPVTVEEGDEKPEQSLKEIYSGIGTWPSAKELPIVYHRGYNFAFLGLEKGSKWDAWKLDKVFHLLVEKGLVQERKQPTPVKEVSEEVLRMVHDERYLQELQTSKMAWIRMTEIPALLMVPNFLVQSQIAMPLKYQAAGTILALGIALERGWAINLGGGMIHAGHERGAGWCPYDDLTLAIHFARKHTDKVKRVMIIDLGAHQGNGYQRNKLHFKDDDVFIVDVFNEVIFPQDHDARTAIDVQRSLPCGTSSEVYLSSVTSALQQASTFEPDIILYAAGTNVLEEDYSGQFHVTYDVVLLRDRLVFEFAFAKKVPICMVVSSGYAGTNFQVVADSIDALVKTLHLS